MNQTTHTADDEQFIRQVTQTYGLSVQEIASRLFHDLLMGLVPASFADRALKLYHAAESLRVSEQD